MSNDERLRRVMQNAANKMALGYAVQAKAHNLACSSVEDSRVLVKADFEGLETSVLATFEVTQIRDATKRKPKRSKEEKAREYFKAYGGLGEGHCNSPPVPLGQKIGREPRPHHKETQEVDQQARAIRERAELLEYQLSELIGCMDEFSAIPCKSLQERMEASANIARKTLRNKP